MRLPEGLNIQVTPSQYDFLYDLVMTAYDLDIPDQKGWDTQTVSYTHLRAHET